MIFWSGSSTLAIIIASPGCLRDDATARALRSSGSGPPSRCPPARVTSVSRAIVPRTLGPRPIMAAKDLTMIKSTTRPMKMLVADVIGGADAVGEGRQQVPDRNAETERQQQLDQGELRHVARQHQRLGLRREEPVQDRQGQRDRHDREQRHRHQQAVDVGKSAAQLHPLLGSEWSARRHRHRQDPHGDRTFQSEREEQQHRGHRHHHVHRDQGAQQEARLAPEKRQVRGASVEPEREDQRGEGDVE